MKAPGGSIDDFDLPFALLYLNNGKFPLLDLLRIIFRLGFFVSGWLALALAMLDTYSITRSSHASEQRAFFEI